MITLGISLVLLIGMIAQWLSWRWGIPAIVGMTLMGLFIGPGINLIHPDQLFGDLLEPIISLAVAIILFEGSLSLDRREIFHFKGPVRRMYTLVPLISWLLTAVIANVVVGLSWVTAFVIGGLFIVTGPTVITPLLKNANLKERPDRMLRWEGIIVDPMGALAALFALQIGLAASGVIDSAALGVYILGAFTALVLGIGAGLGTSYSFRRSIIPVDMQAPMMFALVIFIFAVSDLIMEESGLLAVTAMGITLANRGLNVPILNNIRHFKENISTLFISAVFVLLTSSLTRTELMELWDIRIIGFVLLMMLVVRPLSVWIGLANTKVSLGEKAFIGWIAPRGVVALTVSGYFQTILVEAGFTDAERILPMTLALVFITVVIHGYTLTPLAKRLKLTK
ncbi:cation:proton antiporter [Marinococcus halophilus]|uniref:cation:proton antiporter n=1 Tax=Marinococcus halophilus TaxID=1371 RepID=UPI001FD5E37B|nr:sodium:proton antiporter [Marinococcus halophilus]